MRPGDQLPGADESWKTVVSTVTYRPAVGFKVYDVFLDSKRAPMEHLLNMDGLLAPSYDWQKELATLPNATAFDMLQPSDLW